MRIVGLLITLSFSGVFANAEPCEENGAIQATQNCHATMAEFFGDRDLYVDWAPGEVLAYLENRFRELRPDERPRSRDVLALQENYGGTRIVHSLVYMDEQNLRHLNGGVRVEPVAVLRPTWWMIDAGFMRMRNFRRKD